jgi:Na+-driven multidrug efflux pump
MQVGSALHDSVDFLLISKAFGSYGLEATGLAALIRFVCQGISLYFGLAATIKLPMLIGENRQADARQLIVDLYRISIVLAMLLAIVVYYISGPMLHYMGCPADMFHDSLTYIRPIACSIPFLTITQLSLGIIQGEGRSVLCGALQVGVFVLNCGVLGPIILFVCHAPIRWASSPYILAHVVPGLILIAIIHRGVFSLKPKWRMWIGRIGRDVWRSLKLASSFLLFLVTNTFPPMLLVHYLLKAAKNIDQLDPVNAAFNVVMKTTVFVNSWTLGFSQGFMASGSYATGAKDIGRFVSLALWGFVFCLVTQVIFIPICIADPWIPSSIWLHSEEEKYWARQFNGIPFYTQFLQAASEVTNCICMSFGNAWVPLIPAVVKGCLEIGTVIGLYDTGDGHTNPTRIVFVYPVMDGAVFILDVIFLFTIIIPYVKKQRKAEEAARVQNYV